MAGALMQLVAYGAQDVYLTGNPQITFFKAVYRRHTNFAMESMEQTLSGNPGANQSTVCRVSRNGDLMGPTYVEMTTTQQQNAVAGRRGGYRLVTEVELRIGGQQIDRQTGLWMDCWATLSNSTAQQANLARMCGGLGEARAAGLMYVPLQFSYCRNPGLAIPLIALQYHEVELAIELGGPDNAGALNNVSVWVDYIFLDTEERKTFAQNPHEYLIETVQYVEDSVVNGDNNNTRLTFNHPVKELVWTLDNAGALEAMNGAGTGAVLRLNGQDRFRRREAAYFNRVQQYQHHTNGSTLVNCYSFALKPEEHQPSGTCNFSRIDNANLIISHNANRDLTVMAHGYNVLRVASGMGGLAYSN